MTGVSLACESRRSSGRVVLGADRWTTRTEQRQAARVFGPNSRFDYREWPDGLQPSLLACCAASPWRDGNAACARWESQCGWFANNKTIERRALEPISSGVIERVLNRKGGHCA